MVLKKKSVIKFLSYIIAVFKLVIMLSFRINMYSEGLTDLMEMIMILPFTPDPKPKLDNIQSKAKERYLPVYEKVK